MLSYAPRGNSSAPNNGYFSSALKPSQALHWPYNVFGIFKSGMQNDLKTLAAQLTFPVLSLFGH